MLTIKKVSHETIDNAMATMINAKCLNGYLMSLVSMKDSIEKEIAAAKQIMVKKGIAINEMIEG